MLHPDFFSKQNKSVQTFYQIEQLLCERSTLKDLSVLFCASYHTMQFQDFSFFVLYKNPFVIFFQSLGNPSSNDGTIESKQFKYILWAIVGGTRGGPNRARILDLLISEPLNSNQISKKLNLDHKTIRHHLKILTKNLLITKPSDESYGATYTLTPIMQKNVQLLEEIVSKMRN